MSIRQSEPTDGEERKEEVSRRRVRNTRITWIIRLAAILASLAIVFGLTAGVRALYMQDGYCGDRYGEPVYAREECGPDAISELLVWVLSGITVVGVIGIVVVILAIIGAMQNPPVRLPACNCKHQPGCPH